MTTAKNEVFVGLKLEKFYLEGGGSLLGEIFPGGGWEWANFWLVGCLPHLPSVGKPCSVSQKKCYWESEIKKYLLVIKVTK